MLKLPAPSCILSSLIRMSALFVIGSGTWDVCETMKIKVFVFSRLF